MPQIPSRENIKPRSIHPRILSSFSLGNNIPPLLVLLSLSIADRECKAIRNKLVGQATEIFNLYDTSLILENTKSNLILHYTDQTTRHINFDKHYLYHDGEQSLNYDYMEDNTLQENYDHFYEIDENENFLCFTSTNQPDT
ncbi:hypothetical protein GQX74_000180 [Glossina fuscipes]|nr:hypothetical protein GQX74_000180 [Glossina fuscipes]